MDLNSLTPEEKASLKKQIEAEDRAAKVKSRENKEAFKSIQSEFVEEFFPKLATMAQNLTLAKAELFENAGTIFDMKCDVFNISEAEFEKQQSHSISNADYSKTIIMGHNIVDGWDTEVANAGVQKVNEWLTKKATDTNLSLISIIRDLLKPNKEGLLKANRVLELMNQAEKIGEKELIDAVSLIREAYRPVKTTTFIKAKMKDEDGRDVWLNLSMSNA